MREPGRARIMRILLVGTMLCTIVGAVACRPAQVPDPPPVGPGPGEPQKPAQVYAQVEHLLGGETLREAMETAANALPEEREAVAELLSSWASTILMPGQQSTMYEEYWACEAYITALTINPAGVHLYENLGRLVVRWHRESIGMGHDCRYPGDRDDSRRAGALGLTAWESAASAQPDQRSLQGFNEVGAMLAIGAREYARAAELDPSSPDALMCAAIEALLAGNRGAARSYAERLAVIAPRRGDVLCLLTELGMLAPVPTTKVFETALPDGFMPYSLQACGEKMVVTGEHGWMDQRTYMLGPGQPEPPRVIAKANKAALSPTGSFLALRVRETREADDEIRIVDLLTGEERLLVTAKHVLDFAWAPDEAALAVSTSQELMLVRLESGTRKVLDQAEQRPDFWQVAAHPQFLGGGGLLGAQLEIDHGPLSAGPDAVYRFDLGSGDRVRIDIEVPLWDLGLVSWSPDGQLIACELSTKADSVSRGIIVVSPETAATHHIALTDGYVHAQAGAWSEDGTRLLFRMGLWPVFDHWEQPPTSAWPKMHWWVWDAMTGDVSPISHSIWSHVTVSDGIVYATVSDSDHRYSVVGVRVEGW